MATSWTVTAVRTYSDIDGLGTQVADLDDITVDSGGKLTLDAAWLGSDGSRGMNGITVNAGGVHIQEAGTTCLIKDTYKITLTEGAQWRSLGALGSRCIISGENITSATHYIYLDSGGRFYSDYTDIKTFIRAFYVLYDGVIEMHNSTISAMTYAPITMNYAGGGVLLVGCTIAAASDYYCIWSRSNCEFMAIDTTFTSVTDNHLAMGVWQFKGAFANCTYQGVPIEVDDFGETAQDLDIRIYEESPITESNSISDVIIGALHPSMDTEGMLYDTTNYLKIPGYLAIPPTVTGTSKAYLLKKSAYWPSGTAVADRTWKYWSDSGQAISGDNQYWTILGSKSGYSSDTDTGFAGDAMTLSISRSGGATGRMVQGMV